MLLRKDTKGNGVLVTEVGHVIGEILQVLPEMQYGDCVELCCFGSEVL